MTKLPLTVVGMIPDNHGDEDDHAGFESRLAPRLTSDGIGEGPERERRLLVVSGFLRARLTAREFDAIYRMHDHKGMLTVGVSLPRGHHHIDADRIEREVKAAWEAVNEYDSEVHYAPRW